MSVVLCQVQKEDMLGRKMTTDAFIPFVQKRTHIACAHAVPEVLPIDSTRHHNRVFRVSMPYGKDESGPGREEGLMYMHMSNTTEVFTSILTNIAGTKVKSAPGEVTVDKLLSDVQPLLGTWWYVPSADELGLETFVERR